MERPAAHMVEPHEPAADPPTVQLRFGGTWGSPAGQRKNGDSIMRTFKYAAGVALAGVLAIAAVTPSQARHWNNAAAAGVGFAAGAVVGAVAASANNGYYGNNGYYYNQGYAGDYAYAPGPGYTYPAGSQNEGDYYAYDSGPGYYGYGGNGYGNRWATQHNTNNFSADSQR